MKEKKEKLNRRSLVKNAVALAGAGLIGSLTKSVAGTKIPETTTAGAFYNVTDFGATGKKRDKATQPIQAAIDACAAAGGGTVYVPPGDFTVGTLELKTNVTFHIEAGATLYLSQDDAEFYVQDESTMIFAQEANNITISGRGTFDGVARYKFTEMQNIDAEIVEEMEIARKAGIDMRRYYRDSMATFMFKLNDCTNVSIRDITIINSPLWNVRLNDCNRVFVRGVYIYSDLDKGVNADGIDICSSHNVTISDSVIITADDAIALKTPGRQGRDRVNTTENIVVTNCILSSSSTPLNIGTETLADIRHVIFSNCTIRNSNKGIGINVQDGATVSDVVVSNLTVETSRRHWNWWGSAELCKFVLKRREDSSPLGQIKDVIIENVIAHTRGTSTIRGHADQPLENIRLSNIRIYMDPENAKDKRATHAFEAENVRELNIKDLSVRWNADQAEEKWKSALALKNVSDFEVINFSGRQGIPDSHHPAIFLDNVSDGVISDSRATEDCATFIRVEGKKSQGIRLRDNDTRKAEKAVSFAHKDLKRVVKID